MPLINPSSEPKRLWQLEALRGFAAFYVMLHHISSNYLNLKHTIWGLPFRFGQEGVLVFFMLSGFVICHSHSVSRQNDFATYLFKRGRRIFPVFIISLLLAYFIACVGRHSFVTVDFRLLCGNLFMLQDQPDKPGTHFPPFADNMPLWSLSYEWWFYMMFYPINRWVAVGGQKYLVLGLCFVGMAINLFMPNGLCWFLVFFPIWWLGVEMAREFLDAEDVTLHRQKAILSLLIIPIIWYLVLTWRWFKAGLHVAFIAYPFLEFRYFIMTLVFFVLAIAWKRLRFIGFRSTIGHFKHLAPFSYAIYLFHYPIICDLRLFKDNSLFYLDLIIRVMLTFALAWLMEGCLQNWLNAATNPWLKRKIRPASVVIEKSSG